jgi:hypothetical protein
MAKPFLNQPDKVELRLSTLLRQCLEGQQCGSSCPCKVLPDVVDSITDDLDWEALPIEITGDKSWLLIPSAAVKLFQNSHDALGQQAMLLLYRR